MEWNFYISSFNLSLKRFSRKTKSSLKSGSWPTFLSFLVNTEKITSVVCSHIWAFLVILWLKQRRICMFLKSLKRRGGGHFPLLRHLTGSLQSAYLRSKGSSWHHSSISENPDSSHRSHRWFLWTFGLLLGLLLRNRFGLSKLFGPLFGFLTDSISVRRSLILPSVSAGIKLWFFKCRYSG